MSDTQNVSSEPENDLNDGGRTSPIVQSAERSRMRRSQSRGRSRNRQTTLLESAERNLRDARVARSRTRSPITTPEVEDGEVNDPADNPERQDSPGRRSTRCRGRKSSSVVWNHCKKHTDPVTKKIITKCNYCGASWALLGSTSTALHHLKQHHIQRLSSEERTKLLGGSTTPNSALPARSTTRNLFDGPLISKNSPKGRRCNEKLARALLSGSISIQILDNIHFGIFCEELCSKYRLPSRFYMTNSVIPKMFYETKLVVKNKL